MELTPELLAVEPSNIFGAMKYESEQILIESRHEGAPSSSLAPLRLNTGSDLFVIAFWQREDCWIVSRAESKRSARPLARKILTYLPDGIEIRLRENLMGSIFQHSASLTPLDQSEYISSAVVITTTSHSTNTDETSDEKSGGLL